MLVHKCTHRGEHKYSYTGQLTSRSQHAAIVRAPWTFDEVAIAYSRFSPGDIFTETFYEDRWYNIFEIVDAQQKLKGWYANITRPARITADSVEWDDLAIDVWMGVDGIQHIMDEDEFEALKPELSSVEIGTALGAVQQLQAELRDCWRAFANDRIAQALSVRGWTLGTAESCTGGLIGDVLTNRSGSSAYFMGGVISYSNDIKQRVLGVASHTLATHGAVSDICAREMARGVRTALGVDVGMSATGIAGPDGGSADKPVGLVYVGLSTPDGDVVSRQVWPHDRVGNKGASVDEALRLLLTQLNDR
jgi:PncC family amidohydrolase